MNECGTKLPSSSLDMRHAISLIALGLAMPVWRAALQCGNI